MKNLIFVDCEATGPCPGKGELTEFGAVDYSSRQSFHGVLFVSRPSAANPALSELTGEGFDPVAVFAAFDFQWINHGFHHALGRNPFGHSARRISDFYAGLRGDFGQTQAWKRLRITPHDHNPVNDALGNVEAFERILRGER